MRAPLSGASGSCAERATRPDRGIDGIRASAWAIAALVAVFAWFASGVERWKLGRWEDLEADVTRALWPPWRALQLPVSYGGDERLYFQYAQLLLGQPADLGYVARKRQEPGDAGRSQAALARRVSPAPGARLPYRDFPFEYPPLALAAMLAPRLLADTLAGYRVAFALTMGGLYLALAGIAVRLARLLDGPAAPIVWRRSILLALATGPLLAQRFDLLIATLVAAALLALARGRDGRAGVLLGLGAMTKLYPALLLLPIGLFLLGARAPARLIRLAAAAAITVAAVCAPFLVAAPGPFLRAMGLYGARPFQLESLPGSLALALAGAGTVAGGFGSYNVALPAWTLAAGQLAFWAGLAAMGLAAARSGHDLRRASAADQTRAIAWWTWATVAVLLCTSKVLSPQFLIWLLPWPAVLPGAGALPPRTRIALYWSIAALALTQAFYPFLYAALRGGQPVAVALLLARNAALVALAASVIPSVTGWTPLRCQGCTAGRSDSR